MLNLFTAWGRTITLKKILFLLLIFINGCGRAESASYASTASLSKPDFSNKHFMETFTFNDSCPNVCFFGINTNITTRDEAMSILSGVSSIDKTSIAIKENQIFAIWYPENNKEDPSLIYIGLDDNKLTQINISQVVMTVGDFTDIIGEPDFIAVFNNKYPEVGDQLMYALYFTKWKLDIDSGPDKKVGPQKTDRLFSITINSNIINMIKFQPWKGYGNINEYMKLLIEQ
jgi:hypothetical protein